MGQALAHGVAAASGRRMPFALTYHGLGHETRSDDPHGLMTSPETFTAQLDALLARRYRLVGIRELWTAVARGGRAADGLGAITFDDGLAVTSHVLAELCAARGITCTVFLAPGLFGRDHPDLPSGRLILRADEVAELERSGVEIGAHSWSHVDLPTLGRDQQLEELRRSRGELEELVGHPVTTMAYPYGRYDPTTLELVRKAGYDVACANDGSGPWRALELPREPVHASTTLSRIWLKAAGLYGPAKTVKRLLGRPTST